MTAALRFCNVVYWLALTLWVAALTTAGIAAMNTFSRLPRMNIEMKSFAALPPEQHGRLAAGMVMEGVFSTVDWIQIFAAPLAVFTLILQIVIARLRWRTIPNLLRSFCILVAAGLFVFHISTVAPKMNQRLHSYWQKLEAGDVDDAQADLAVFNALHPVADKLLRINLVLLLAGIGASALVTSPWAGKVGDSPPPDIVE